MRGGEGGVRGGEGWASCWNSLREVKANQINLFLPVDKWAGLKKSRLKESFTVERKSGRERKTVHLSQTDHRGQQLIMTVVYFSPESLKWF